MAEGREYRSVAVCITTGRVSTIIDDTDDKNKPVWLVGI